jgi:hypothetical protein
MGIKNAEFDDGIESVRKVEKSYGKSYQRKSYRKMDF